MKLNRGSCFAAAWAVSILAHGGVILACAADDAALEKTQDLLTSPTERNQAIRGDAAAEKVDAQVHALAGSAENAEEIYAISGRVFGDLMKGSDGDIKKVEQILSESKTDPEKLSGHLSEESKAAIRSLAGKVPEPERK